MGIKVIHIFSDDFREYLIFHCPLSNDITPLRVQYDKCIIYSQLSWSLYYCCYIFIYGMEKGMAVHSSICAWRIPWIEKPGRLQSVGSQRVGHD